MVTNCEQEIAFRFNARFTMNKDDFYKRPDHVQSKDVETMIQKPEITVDLFKLNM